MPHDGNCPGARVFPRALVLGDGEDILLGPGVGRCGERGDSRLLLLLALFSHQRAPFLVFNGSFRLAIFAYVLTDLLHVVHEAHRQAHRERLVTLLGSQLRRVLLLRVQQLHQPFQRHPVLQAREVARVRPAVGPRHTPRAVDEATVECARELETCLRRFDRRAPVLKAGHEVAIIRRPRRVRELALAVPLAFLPHARVCARAARAARAGRGRRLVAEARNGERTATVTHSRCRLSIPSGRSRRTTRRPSCRCIERHRDTLRRHRRAGARL